MRPNVLIVSSDAGLRALLCLGLKYWLGANVAARVSEWEQGPRLTRDLRPDIAHVLTNPDRR